MPQWIALLRGINVVGNNRLPMKELVADLQSLRLENIRTYIQSGNVIFDAKEKVAGPLALKIGKQIERQHGFRPHVLLLSAKTLQATIDANPFKRAAAVPQSLHFYFLDQPPAKPDVPALDAVKAKTESYLITDRVFYLLAPEGIGRSKLAASVERRLGVAATARNYRTVCTLAEMAKQ
jgi:uncharacterized protein (DUF1697 family)